MFTHPTRKATWLWYWLWLSHATKAKQATVQAVVNYGMVRGLPSWPKGGGLFYLCYLLLRRSSFERAWDVIENCCWMLLEDMKRIEIYKVLNLIFILFIFIFNSVETSSVEGGSAGGRVMVSVFGFQFLWWPMTELDAWWPMTAI